MPEIFNISPSTTASIAAFGIPHIGAGISTVLGLVGFIAGLCFLAYRVRIKTDLSQFQALPPEHQPKAADNLALRYGIKLDDVPKKDRVQLVREEMAMRSRDEWRKTLLFVSVGSLLILAGMVLAAITPGDRSSDPDSPSSKAIPPKADVNSKKVESRQYLTISVWEVRKGVKDQRVAFPDALRFEMTNDEKAMVTAVQKFKQSLIKLYKLEEMTCQVTVDIPPQLAMGDSKGIVTSGKLDLYKIEYWLPVSLTSEGYKHFPFMGMSQLAMNVKARNLSEFYFHIERPGFSPLTKLVEVRDGLKQEFTLGQAPVVMCVVQDPPFPGGWATSFGDSLVRGEWNDKFQIKDKQQLDALERLYKTGAPIDKRGLILQHQVDFVVELGMQEQ